VRKELLGRGRSGSFIDGLRRRDQEVAALVVTAAKPNDGNTSRR
jgi:hypothetical protein